MLPFLPKSRNEKVISLGLDDQGTSQTEQTIGFLTHTRTHWIQNEDWLVCSCVISFVFQMTVAMAPTRLSRCTQNGITLFLSDLLW